MNVAQRHATETYTTHLTAYRVVHLVGPATHIPAIIVAVHYTCDVAVRNAISEQNNLPNACPLITIFCRVLHFPSKALCDRHNSPGQ